MKCNLVHFALVLGLFLSPLSTALAAPSYCLAIRGNGESQPAHWGAMANVVEKLGLPQKQSGGSSASISLFLLDQIASNPVLQYQEPEIQKSQAALLIKSLMGLSIYLKSTPTAQGILDLAQKKDQLQKQINEGDWSLLKELAQGVNQDKLRSESARLLKLVAALQALGLGDSPAYSLLLRDLAQQLKNGEVSSEQAARIQFYSQDLQNAIQTFGSFDAESDPDLFFREGIVNFRKLGKAIGKVGSFLSGQTDSLLAKSTFRNFLRTCEPLHRGLTWLELVQKEPRCQELLVQAFRFHFEAGAWRNPINEVVGLNPKSRIESLPTTALLTENAARQAEQALKRYHQNFDRNASKDFRVQNVSEVRFGYWGSKPTLAKIEKNLSVPFQDSSGRSWDFSQDLKSQHFTAIEEGTWRDVLGLSPAEPGLSSIQKMKSEKLAFSAGGWSDLHPVAVLRAAGCENVVYLTRRGGESLFGQGVAKRLLNLERDWSLLRTKTEEQKKENSRLNNLGDASDLTSEWSRMYNVANENSSFRKALRSADAILCTDWNRFELKKNFIELVHESYAAPYVLQGNLNEDLSAQGAKILNESLAGCH